MDEKSVMEQSMAIEYDLGDLEKMDPTLGLLTSPRIPARVRQRGPHRNQNR
jgi:hypothetical protein